MCCGFCIGCLLGVSLNRVCGIRGGVFLPSGRVFGCRHPAKGFFRPPGGFLGVAIRRSYSFALRAWAHPSVSHFFFDGKKKVTKKKAALRGPFGDPAGSPPPLTLALPVLCHETPLAKRKTALHKPPGPVGQTPNASPSSRLLGGGRSTPPSLAPPPQGITPANLAAPPTTPSRGVGIAPPPPVSPHPQKRPAAGARGPPPI